MPEDEMRQAAAELRASLDQVISDDADRATVAERITLALDDPSDDARIELRKALASHPATRDWMRRRQTFTVQVDRIAGPLGNPTAALGTLYICPRQDYSVVLDTVSDEAQLCPKDGSVLERQNG